MNKSTKLLVVLAFLAGYVVNDIVRTPTVLPAFAMAQLSHKNKEFRNAVERVIDDYLDDEYSNFRSAVLEVMDDDGEDIINDAIYQYIGFGYGDFQSAVLKVMEDDGEDIIVGAVNFTCYVDVEELGDRADVQC